MFLVFAATCVKNVKSGDGLEKRADLEYDVLVKRKNKTGKKPGFKKGDTPTGKGGQNCRWR